MTFLMQCPSCPVHLQPLSVTSGWLDQARAHAAAMGVPIPAAGPVALSILALVAHQMVLHDELDLMDYLNAYSEAKGT